VTVPRQAYTPCGFRPGGCHGHRHVHPSAPARFDRRIPRVSAGPCRRVAPPTGEGIWCTPPAAGFSSPGHTQAPSCTVDMSCPSPFTPSASPTRATRIGTLPPIASHPSPSVRPAGRTTKGNPLGGTPGLAIDRRLGSSPGTGSTALLSSTSRGVMLAQQTWLSFLPSLPETPLGAPGERREARRHHAGRRLRKRRDERERGRAIVDAETDRLSWPSGPRLLVPPNA
jgi:hypothetical protein